MGQEIDPFEGIKPLPKIVAVSLQKTGHLYNFRAGYAERKRGDRVLIESEAGTRVGTVEVEPHEPARSIDISSMRPIIRVASDDDFNVEKETLARETNARHLCVERIRAHRLQMKLVNADYTFDGRKAVFYFVAEGRVDFRDLVRDLANSLRVRVEMKQIGARDETKVTGGLVPGRRALYCSSWLPHFEAASSQISRDPVAPPKPP